MRVTTLHAVCSYVRNQEEETKVGAGLFGERKSVCVLCAFVCVRVCVCIVCVFVCVLCVCRDKGGK